MRERLARPARRRARCTTAVRRDQGRRWSRALHDVFLLGAVLAALGIVTVLFLKELPLRRELCADARGAKLPKRGRTGGRRLGPVAAATAA